MSTKKSYSSYFFLRPLTLLVLAALAASVMAVVVLYHRLLFGPLRLGRAFEGGISVSRRAGDTDFRGGPRRCPKEHGA